MSTEEELDLQVVESGNNVAHEGHEKEGHLENIFADEIETFDDGIIPGDGVEGVDKRQEPEEHAHADNLW